MVEGFANHQVYAQTNTSNGNMGDLFTVNFVMVYVFFTIQIFANVLLPYKKVLDPL